MSGYTLSDKFVPKVVLSPQSLFSVDAEKTFFTYREVVFLKFPR